MSIATNTSPYFDDSQNAIDENYQKILFKPGYAVQARELTQLQSILQNQISQLGDFVLADGSPVSGGHISFDGTVTALSLQQQYANTDINLSDFFVNGENTLIVNASGPVTVKAVVVGIDNTQINPIIVVKYLTGTKFSDGATIQVASGVQSQATLITSNSASPASVASISYGVFYSGGHFVTVEPQTIVLSSSNSAPTLRIGLEIDEAIVTSSSDTTLLDPAQGAFNYQAPGADRYQYGLSLAYRTFSSTDDSAFYNLVVVENGLITSQVDYPVLGAINDTLAQRTYDTNGDFTVKPFIITTGVNPANASQYAITVSPGKAFVKGYEFETVGSTTLYADKALNTNNIVDYSFSQEFGNILTVTNLYAGACTGSFNIAGYQNVDVHCVTSGNINNASNTTYSATKIGVAKIRDIEFLGLGNYYAYVLDLNVAPQTFTTGTAGNVNTIVFPSAYAGLAANAFANVAVTVNTAPYTDQRVIASYNAISQIATLQSPLSTASLANTSVSLNFAIKDLNSLVITPNQVGNVYATQQIANAFCACMDIALGGKDAHGNTVLADTQFNKMIWSLPQSVIQQGSVIGSTSSFYARASYLNQPFNSGQLTLSSGAGLGTQQVFPYGVTGGLISDVTANANFIVVVRTVGTSNLTAGQVLVMDRNFRNNTAGNGVVQTDQTHVTIITNTTGTFNGDVYFTVQQQNAASSVRRTKTLIGNSSITTLRSTDSIFNNSGAVIGLTGGNTNNVVIDSANGYVWYTAPSTLANTPGATQSLYIPDVFNIIKIYDSGNTAYPPSYANNGSLIDITANYFLSSGQNDNYYDHAFLTLKPGANPPTGQVLVMCQYFSHTPSAGFFDVDSYSSAVYNAGLIPYYSSPAFGSFALRDSIDFRPTRLLGNAGTVAAFLITGLEIPQPDHTMTLSYSFYLPRIDKLLLNKSGMFLIKEGVSSQYPVTPSDASDSMTLYILSVPAFTANVSQITLQYVQNKRYTMKDVGTIDARVTQLEYYSTLSQLEAQAQGETILYQDNVTAKDQYGIIADDFGDFSIVDNHNIDLKAYLQQGTLSPFKLSTPLALTFANSTANVQQNERTITLPYTETPAIVQNNATAAVSVQPYLFAQFTGTVKLYPQTDYWFSPMLLPQVIQPPSANPALPPLPAPVAAPGLTPAANVAPPAAPVISGNQVDTVTYWYSPYYYWYYGYGYGGVYGYRRVIVPVGHASYGVLSPISNWFGKLTVPLNTVSANVSTQATTGGSIQLQAGNKITNSTTINNSSIKRL